MKSIYKYLFAFSLLALVSCTDDAVEPDLTTTNQTIKEEVVNGGAGGEENDTPLPPPPAGP